MQDIVVRLQTAGHQAYPVGGAVRDLLLERNVGDWDVATSARPDQVTRLFVRTVPTGIDHGTVTVLAGRMQIEVTTFRGELGYSDGRHPDRVVFLDSLEEDLRRRDFTVNAMAYDTSRQRIIDPFGGRRDLRAGLVRAVGDPGERFAEDGLRPMRAVRFACVLGFRIEKRTRLAIPASMEVLRKVAPERIRDELLKILAVRDAARGIELLRETGLLSEVLPELLPTVDFSQNRFHRHDVYRHTLRCLEKSRGDPVLKLAVLLHDIGKPDTAEGPPGAHTFYNHERRSAEIADRVMRRLRFSNAERKRVTGLIDGHMFHYLPEWSDGAVRRFVRRVGPERLDDMWEMRRADAWGRGTGVRDALANLRALRRRVDKVMTEDAALKVTDLAIDGNDVMQALGAAPGPRIGRILEGLLDRVLDDPSLNRRDRLLAMLPDIAS